MKRSRIFFGLTAACLAVAGAVTAKINHCNCATQYYRIPGRGCFPIEGVCINESNLVFPKKCLYQVQGLGSITVFTNNNCTSTVLYTKAEN